MLCDLYDFLDPYMSFFALVLDMVPAVITAKEMTPETFEGNIYHPVEIPATVG